MAFDEKKVEAKIWDDDPIPSLPEESILNAQLRAIWPGPNYSFLGWNDGDDPLQLIRAANSLRRLGKDEALAVMIREDRIERCGAKWLFSLAETLFLPKEVGNSSNSSQKSSVSSLPGSNSDFLTSDSIKIVDGIPFPEVQEEWGDYQPTFEDSSKGCSEQWRIRPQTLRPPDDPFPVLLSTAKNHSPSEIKYGMFRRILLLIRGAYLSPNIANYQDDYNYEAEHRAFLATGARWDAGKQTYVRRDGTALPDSYYTPYFQL